MKMEWFSNRVRGSVSIMLCIVMLPMIIFSSIVVDASRLMAAKTIMSGAGDLVLNARMSEFDTVLQEMYGLFASSSSEEDLQVALKDYYTKTIEGIIPGTDRKDIESYVDELVGMLFDVDSMDDFNFDKLVSLKVSDQGFSISGVESSALANPAVLKRQIIDEMKYRAPVSIASSLLNKIHAFRNSDAQATVVEKKLDYTRELSTLTGACMTALEDILAYDVLCNVFNENKNRFAYDVCNRARYLYYGAVLAEAYRSQVRRLLDNREMVETRTIQQIEKDCLIEEEKREDLKTTLDWGESQWAPEEGGYGAIAKPDNLLQHINGLQEEIEQLKNAINGLADTRLNSVGALEKHLQLDYEVIEKTESTGQVYRVIQNRNEKRWMGKIETTLSHLKSITNDNYDYNQISIKTIQPIGDSTEIRKSSWSEWLDFTNNQKEIIGNKDFESKISDTKIILLALKEEVEKLEKRVSYFESAVTAYEKELSNNEEGESGLPEDLVAYQRITKHELEQYKALITEAENIEKILTGVKSIYSADVHENVSKHFLQDAFECCADYYVNVKMISYYAEKSSKDLQRILDIVKKLKTKKEEWWQSINKVNDGVTRAQFENEYKSMTEMYKEEEIEDLANEFLQGKLKKPQADEIKQAIDGISIFRKKVIKYSIDFTISYEENAQSETEKKEDEVFSPSERENLNVSPAKREKMMAFCKPSHGVEYRDIYAYVYAKAASKNGQIDDCYKLADEIVHDGDSKYTVPTFFLTGELPNNSGNHSESVFRSATALKEIEEMGYVDGFKDNPETYLGNEPNRDETLRDFLKEIEKVEKAKEKKEKFFFVLMELAPAEQQATKTEDQSKQEENLNKSISNDKTLTKKPANEGENEQPEVASIKKEIGEYIKRETKGEADKGKGMNKANLSNMEKTSVPTTKASKKDGYKDEGKKASDSVSNGKSILSDILSIGEKIAQNAYLEEYFTEMFSCDTDKVKQSEVKNLLGIAYDSSTAWYGKEVEYIIWGDENLDNNITYMYQSIFAIRFVLNTIYAFTAADIQSFALQLATVIAGWTVFGVPLVQAAITIGLAIAESGLDIKDLSEGKDVVIYKSVHTFKCSPTNLAKTVATEIVDPIIDGAKDAISDKVHEWTDELSGTIEKNIDVLNGYVDDMVTKPIDGMVDQVTDFICNPINTALQKYTTRVQTLDGFTKESIGSSVDSTIAMIRETAQNQSPSVMKDAELTAIDYFEKNIASGLKNELYGLMDGTNPLDLSKVQNIVKSKVKNDIAFLEKIKSSFTSMTSEMATEIKKELGELKDQGVEAFDEFIDKKAGELSGRISGTITKEAGKWVENNKDITTSSGGLNLTLNYKEYCKIFTFVALIGNENEMLRRTAVLIQLNVNKKKGSDGGKFEIITAYTLFRLQSKVTMRTMLPWGVEAKVEDETGTDSWNLSLDKMGESEMTIDYTGVCGY